MASSAQSEKTQERRRWPIIIRVPLVGVIVLGLLAAILLFLPSYLLYGLILQLVIWVGWCTRGINVLLVYSESPNWQAYIDTNLIPKLPPSTVVMNWSNRRQWSFFSIWVRAFRYFGGAREFNPLVVVFKPFRWARTYRFFKPLRQYKHGKTTDLEELERELFRQLPGIDSTAAD